MYETPIATADSQLLDRLANKIALIGIIGLGYVGLPLVPRYVESGSGRLG